MRTVISEQQPSDRLFVLTDAAGGFLGTTGDHGRVEYSAFSDSADAPGPTRPETRTRLQSLQDDRGVVWVDPGPNGEAGLSVLGFDRKRSRLRVAPADGSVFLIGQLPGLLWRRRLTAAMRPGERAFEVTRRRTRYASVIVLTPAVPDAARRIAASLEGRAHPEIIVATVDDVPRAWKDLIFGFTEEKIRSNDAETANS